MPLFNYKCNKCEHIMEKFQHKSEDDLDIVCEECQNPECEKQMPFSHNRTLLNARDMLKDKIGPDAKRIMDNMKKGKNRDFFDIYGDK